MLRLPIYLEAAVNKKAGENNENITVYSAEKDLSRFVDVSSHINR